jgi:hypothetical protein
VGQQATIAQGEVTTRIEATPGTVVVSGQQATLVSRTHIAATAATVVVSGQTATIEQIVAGAVVCTPATIVVSGQQASISQTVKIAATAATVVVTGQQATITQRTGIEATPATVVVSGQQATIVSYTKTSIEATPATVTVTGQQATIVETSLVTTTVACTPGLVIVSGGVGNVVSIGGLKGRRRRKYRTTLPEPTEPEIPGTPPTEHGAAFTLASMLQQPSPEPGLLPKARPVLRVVGGSATIKEARRPSPEERMATALEQIAGALREDPRLTKALARRLVALLGDDTLPEDLDEEELVLLLLAQRAA